MVVTLVMALPPESLTKALMRGGSKYEGWSVQMEALAAIFDALNLQTEVTGRWKDKPPSLMRFPRPGEDQAKKAKAAAKKPTSVADLFSRFARAGG